MNKDDKKLLAAYWEGWHECFSDDDRSNEFEGIHKWAYKTGWQHYIIGDEVTTIDGWTSERIINEIRTSYENHSRI